MVLLRDSEVAKQGRPKRKATQEQNEKSILVLLLSVLLFFGCTLSLLSFANVQYLVTGGHQNSSDLLVFIKNTHGIHAITLDSLQSRRWNIKLILNSQIIYSYRHTPTDLSTGILINPYIYGCIKAAIGVAVTHIVALMVLRQIIFLCACTGRPIQVYPFPPYLWVRCLQISHAISGMITGVNIVGGMVSCY